MRLWDLCININTDTGFQFDGDVVIPDSDLFDPASHQRFVKFGEVGSLLCNIILQVIDPFYLLVSCGSVYRLLASNTVDERVTDLLEEKQTVFDAFADKSVAAQKVEVDKKTFGNIIQEEIDRINGERKSKVKA